MTAIQRQIPDKVPYDDLITVAQAARLTGYSTKSILEKSRAGEIDRWPFSKRRIMILKSSLDRLLISHRKKDVLDQPELFFPS